MEKFFQYKKSKLEIETRNEFYLNPKDMINNDKINENLKCDVFHYLPLNELFVLIFEENIAVIDIKQTISKNFTILKMTAFNDVYTQLFKPEITKVTKFPIQNSLSNFCYKIRENDLKKPKNCVFVETPCNIGKVYYIIEFSNLEFAVLKYNNINQQQQQSTTHYEVVHTHLKNYFLTLNTKMKIIYESPLIFNYNTSLTVVNNSCNSSNSGSSSCSSDVFYILHQVEMYLFIFELNCVDDTYEHKYTINGEGEVKLCKCMFNSSSSSSNNTNEFVIASVTDMNKVYKQFFSVQTRSITNTMCIENTNKGNITSLKYSSRYIIYIQLNRVYVYDNAIERKIRAITFHDFDDCVISYCCLFERLNVIYVFNANGDFIMCEFNSNNSSSSNSSSNEQQCEYVDITSTKKTLSISKLIYAVIPFQNEFGFYILSTQNPIKLSNVSITYFIPDNLITNQTLFTLINNNNNNNAVNNSFYTFTLCEYIIYALRYNTTLIPDDDSSSSSLHIKRINYYITCILNTTTDKSSFITDMLIHYRTHYITQPYDQHKTYLNNVNFKCDFCESEYTRYNPVTNIYQCKNEHQSFACCITQTPFNDGFLYCAYCNLFYSNTFKICLICQIILDNAI